MSGSDGSTARAPLGSLAGLARVPWAPWPIPEVVESTASTMAEIEERAARGAVEGTVVIAEEQTAGRGRRGREWESAARAGLWWSVLLRPSAPVDRLGWLPLVVGVAVARALRAVADVDARLKWPNDVLVGDAKIAGVLAERLSGGAVIVGVGINVDHEATELPPVGTSLRVLGRLVDRTALLIGVLDEVASTYRAWASGADLSEDYADLSITIGAEIVADLGTRTIEGRALGLGSAGELVIRSAHGEDVVVTAGDVTLVRPAR